MKKAKCFSDIHYDIGKIDDKMYSSLQNIWDEAFIQESTSQGIQMQMKTDIVKMSWN